MKVRAPRSPRSRCSKTMQGGPKTTLYVDRPLAHRERENERPASGAIFDMKIPLDILMAARARWPL